jgi:hypothetical protein
MECVQGGDPNRWGLVGKLGLLLKSGELQSPLGRRKWRERVFVHFGIEGMGAKLTEIAGRIPHGSGLTSAGTNT